MWAGFGEKINIVQLRKLIFENDSAKAFCGRESVADSVRELLYGKHSGCMMTWIEYKERAD